jgi:hypothetical protein
MIAATLPAAIEDVCFETLCLSQILDTIQIVVSELSWGKRSNKQALKDGMVWSRCFCLLDAL